MKLIAKTFQGLESVLAQELMNLGADNIREERRAVSFTGDLRMLYRANLWLRTATRILMPIATFRAKSADELYEAARRIDWKQYITEKQTFTIDTTCYSHYYNNSLYATYRLKDAIVDSYRGTVALDRSARPSVDRENPDIRFNLHISEDTVTVSLDSSGESLHKRGWRTAQTAAPINEALAAGMLLMAGWHGQSDFLDPMCGSGTILIEAAMIALNIPPGIYRQGFQFEHWPNFDRELFEELYNDDSDEREFLHHIYGSDKAFYAIRVAEQNIKNAGLQKYITLHQCQFQELKPLERPALIVTNPPYGERLEGKTSPRPSNGGEFLKERVSNDPLLGRGQGEVDSLYSALGTFFKHSCTGSTAWVISSNMQALKHIGLKPSAKIRLQNGELDCLYQQFKLFAGKRSSL